MPARALAVFYRVIMPGRPRPTDTRQTLARVTTLPLALFGGLMGALAISPLLRMRNTHEPFLGPVVVVPVPGWELVAHGIVTALMTLTVLRLALRRPDDVAARTWKLCLLFGWLNCPACLFVWAMVEGAAEAPLVLLLGTVCVCVGGVLIGLAIALPIGFLYGIALFPVMRTVGALRKAPTLDAVPRAIRHVALTIAAVSAPGVLFAHASESAAHASVPTALPLASLALALAAFLVAEARIRRTRAFLRRVARGAEPRWSLVPVDGAALPDLPLLPDDPLLPPSVLLFSPESSATYRTEEPRVLWAVTRRGRE
jgi:hypothetical protein